MDFKTYILLTALALTGVACSRDTALNDEPQPLPVGVGTSEGQRLEEPQPASDGLSLECAIGDAATRTGTGVQTATFASGDQVSVWLSNIKTRPASGGDATEVTSPTEYTCTVAANGSTLTLPIDKTYTYMGAGRYPTAYGIKPKPTSGTFTVATDQSTAASYLASDLVYSASKTYGQSSGVIRMQFQHLLTKIVVRLMKGENSGLEDADLTNAEVKVIARPSCAFNYPTDDFVTMPISDDFSDIVLKTDEVVTTSEVYAGACIIPPQGYATGSTLISVRVNGGGAEFTWSIPSGGKTFEAGKVYTIPITVRDEGWEVQGDVSVSAWGTPESSMDQGTDYYGDGCL